jgi:hypothetical protein
MLDVPARASMLLHFTSSPTAFDRVDETRIFGTRADVAINSFYKHPKSPGRTTSSSNNNNNKRSKTAPAPPLHRKISFNASFRPNHY